MRRLCTLLTFTALTALSGAAAASPSFPEKLQELLDLPCVPQCVLCHNNPNGGFGTTNLFGDSIALADAFTPKDENTLAAVLDELEGGGSGGSGGAPADAGTDGGGSGGTGGSGGGAPVDSDGDGVGDVEELRQGRDPSVAGAGVLCGPTYGCFARVEPRGRIDGGALAAAIAVALGLLALGRRRR